MREPTFELTINPKRLASWANVPIGLDASDHDLGKKYSHARYPLLRRGKNAEPDLSLMGQGVVTDGFSGSAKLLPSLVSRDDLDRFAHLHRALERRRCIVPADRMLDLQPRPSGASCSLSLRSGRVFGLAGIREEREGRPPSFAVITTLVSPALHLFAQCMPVVVADTDRDRWLDDSTCDIPEGLLRPLSESELRDWTLSQGLPA